MVYIKNKDFNTLKEKSKCNLGINLIFIIIAINTDNIADIKHASNKSAVIIKMTENIKKDRMFRAANNLPAKYRRPFCCISPWKISSIASDIFKTHTQNITWNL